MSDTTTSTPDLHVPTAMIVAAFVRGTTMAADALPGLINTVHQALAGLGTSAGHAAPGEKQRPEPAVPINESVFPDRIICLEDGKSFKTLRRHLQSDFGMTPDQYRERWGLPRDYPMTASAYTERRSAMAKTLGLGRPKGSTKAKVAADKAAAAAATPAPKKGKATA